MMNNAEHRRDVRIRAMPDVELLDAILKDSETTAEEYATFSGMRRALDGVERRWLSRKQRAWAEDVLRRLTPIKASEIPTGKPVEPPEMLRPENLPKKPPRRIVG